MKQKVARKMSESKRSESGYGQKFGNAGNRQCDGRDARQVSDFIQWIQRQTVVQGCDEVMDARYDAVDKPIAEYAPSQLEEQLNQKKAVGMEGVLGCGSEGISEKELQFLTSTTKTRLADKEEQKRIDEQANAVMNIIMDGAGGALQTQMQRIMSEKKVETNTPRKRVKAMLEYIVQLAGDQSKRDITDAISYNLEQLSLVSTAQTGRELMEKMDRYYAEWEAAVKDVPAVHEPAPVPSYVEAKRHLLKRLQRSAPDLVEFRAAVDKVHDPATWQRIMKEVREALAKVVQNVGSEAASVGGVVEHSVNTAQKADTSGGSSSTTRGDQECYQFVDKGKCDYGEDCKFFRGTKNHPTNQPWYREKKDNKGHEIRRDENRDRGRDRRDRESDDERERGRRRDRDNDRQRGASARKEDRERSRSRDRDRDRDRDRGRERSSRSYEGSSGISNRSRSPSPRQTGQAGMKSAAAGNTPKKLGGGRRQL